MFYNRALLILLCWCVGAKAANVTFQINLEHEIKSSAFTPDEDRIYVTLETDNSAEGFDLEASATNAFVYTVTGEINYPLLTRVFYRFKVLRPSQGYGYGEGDPRRVFTLVGDSLLLPVVTFLGPRPGSLPVIFQVNMGVQRTKGAFDPSRDKVQVRGNFNGFAPLRLTNSSPNPDLYSGRFNVQIYPQGGFWIYKFNILTASNALVPEGIENRTLSLEFETVPSVLFNDEEGPISPPTSAVKVTFRLNVQPQLEAGTFDPAVHTVDVRGPFADQPLRLKPTSEPSVYSATADLAIPVGSSISYKFALNGAPESIPDRTASITSAELLLPIGYLNDTPPDPSPGALSIVPTGDGELLISWRARPSVVLQTTATFPDPIWLEVPHAINTGSVLVKATNAEAFFRLVASR